MTEIAINTKNRRRTWVAIIFSLIMQGLGQVYCGKLARGLVFNFLNILPLPITIYLFSVSRSPTLVPITLTLFFIAGIIQLIAIIDSACLARHTKTDYELKDYNRWYVYVLLVFIVAGGSIGSALYLRNQTLEAFRVPTASCYPTVVPNDRILANKSAYKIDDPQRGDIVVFINPTNRQENYIKRVVAVAGDTVEIKDGQLYINDKKLQRRKLDKSVLDEIRVEVNGELLEGQVFEETNSKVKYKIILASGLHDKAKHDFAKITVPAHHCFVLGDNRNFSYDSRNFGSIPLATIKGRADYLYCPGQNWSRFGRLDKF